MIRWRRPGGDSDQVADVLGVLTAVDDASFTVRKIASGVGVERVFPLHAPTIDKLEVVRHGRVRRAKLYFLREKLGKSGRLRERKTAE